MKRAAALLLALAVAAPPAALAHSYKRNGLEIIHPRTIEIAEEGVKNVAVYMTIKNTTASDERLIGAKALYADKAELIEPQIISGVKMPMVTPAVTIPAQGTVELNANGPRLLLSGFHKKLDANDTFQIMLLFEKAHEIAVDVVVEQSDAAPAHKH